MARPGGNPDLSKHQFKCDGEPNSAKLSIWIRPSIMDKLKQRPDKNDFIRNAIAKALEEEEALADIPAN